MTPTRTTVLVLDDDALLRRPGYALAERGIAVLQATTGEPAAEWLFRRSNGVVDQAFHHTSRTMRGLVNGSRPELRA